MGLMDNIEVRTTAEMREDFGGTTRETIYAKFLPKLAAELKSHPAWDEGKVLGPLSLAMIEADADYAAVQDYNIKARERAASGVADVQFVTLESIRTNLNTGYKSLDVKPILKGDNILFQSRAAWEKDNPEAVAKAEKMRSAKAAK